MAQDPTMIANSTEKIALKYRNTCSLRLARLGRKVTLGFVIVFNAAAYCDEEVALDIALLNER